eukprot:12912500-Alexandrium_andersonii.AAC.1
MTWADPETPDHRQLTTGTASGGFDTARKCSNRFRTVSDGLWQFRALSGAFGLRPKLPESTPKTPESARNCSECARK